MSLPDLVARFVHPLTRVDVPYMVMGGVAAIIYSEPRYTQDLDLVIQLDADRASAFAAAFPPEEFYVPPIETMATESRRVAFGHFNLSHHETGFRLSAGLGSLAILVLATGRPARETDQ